ncbi:hypothetical protein AOL_s00210g89 [Orbilia oligospora ATCC 24927]|uniref:Uncharacterized protein n=2 Tax=Orbilia oligospora TaxID=2813651 RepID=G1XRT1_ARTOA|nr:hypothetical protein AOL_s00210g89 [Orbilia oligospora ATCC 24927]EGX44108.1 hypothetical protein AOL_s00210g89 [Orbilia oligospora ATCC 24927]
MTKDLDTLDFVKKCRRAICEKTGVWSRALEKWNVGTCAETVPLSVMPIHEDGVVFSLCLTSKGLDKPLGACKTCQATFLSYFTTTSRRVVDLAESGETNAKVG